MSENDKKNENAEVDVSAGEYAVKAIQAVFDLRKINPERPVADTITAVASYASIPVDFLKEALSIFLAGAIQTLVPEWTFGGGLARISNRYFRQVDEELGFGDWQYICEAFFAHDERVRFEKTGKIWPDLPKDRSEAEVYS